jgi:hypothetical protein
MGQSRVVDELRRAPALVAAVVGAVLLTGACGGSSNSSSSSSPGSTSGSTSSASTSAASSSAEATSLATAAAWVDVAAQHKLTPDNPAPEQDTDSSAQRVQQIGTLITGLDFKGLAVQTYNRTQADPSDPSLLVGNYIVKVVVFGSAADAQKFRDADAKDVTDKGKLKKVDTYADGVVLDDSQGHINVMFTIGNVAVDIRTGISEPTPGDGVKDGEKLGDDVVANSKKK